MGYYDKNKNYYGILNVSLDAKPEEIQNAYYSLGNIAMKNKNVATDATQKEYWADIIKELVEAYNVLIDSETRKQYDNERYTLVSYKDVEKVNKPDKIKVTNVEESPEATKKAIIGNKTLAGLGVAILALAIIIAALSTGKKIAHKKQDAKVNDVINVESNEEVSVQTIEQEEIEPKSTTVTLNDNEAYSFTDAFDQAQVIERAEAIQTVLEKSNINSFTVKDIENAIRFVNGSYVAENEMEAYDEMDNFLAILEAYSLQTCQASNFAGGVVDENGVKVALGLDAFLLDNTKNSKFMRESSILFENVLSAQTKEDIIIASKEFLNQQCLLKESLLVDETGTKFGYGSLTESEGFIYGLLSQQSGNIIYSALGSNYVLTYTDNLGQQVDIGIDTILDFYNPLNCVITNGDNLSDDQTTNLLNENRWYLDLRELVKKCLLEKQEYRLVDNGNELKLN